MKKQILNVSFVAVVALVSVFKYFDNHKIDSLTEIALANVEALASDGQIDMRRGYKLVRKSSTCSVCEWTSVENDYCDVHEQQPNCYGGKE